MGSLLQCFRVGIRAHIFRPDSGSMRSPPLLKVVAHLLINKNSLTSYFLVFIRKNILNSSYRKVRAQKKIHDTDSYAFQPATVLPNVSFFWCLKLCYVYRFSFFKVSLCYFPYSSFVHLYFILNFF